ncbi:response regulator transcription factor [Risungbinella massiliensis]|uniref:response regulator transcription factor n=1 Tax=Risungbinella massiliensis TaxID=1329796 RepID=UPI0005CC86AD|nr:response regulator transcription factor [Risungbinella massiliensis]
MREKVLIVEDEQILLHSIAEYLTGEGYNVVPESSPIRALIRIEQENYDLILLDWMMPELTGIELLKKLRKFSEVPVIFLTARGDEVEKLLGLELGADDYITKPFSYRELVTRMRVIFRRTKPSTEPGSATVVYGELILYVDQHQAILAGNKLNLTQTEFKILSLLVQKPGRVWSRAQLVESVLGAEYLGYERSIDTHIFNLRKKCKEIQPNFQSLRTVFGVGYTWEDRV